MSSGHHWDFPFDDDARIRETIRDMEREIARMNAQMQHMERSFPSPPSTSLMLPPSPQARNTNQPIIEEVDDDDEEEEEDEQITNMQHSNGVDWNFSFGFDGMRHGSFFNGPELTTQMYSFSSSSCTGPRGQTYSSSSTTRTGPGGVRESMRTIQDDRNGQSSITIERGIGDRSRRITRTRDQNGVEESRDLLRNMDVEEARIFDQEWSHVQHRLPQGRPDQRRIQ